MNQGALINNSLIESLNRLWAHIPSKRKKQFFLLLVMMLLTAVAEVLSIGSVLPFLGALVSPEKLYELSSLMPLWKWLEFTDPNQLIFPLTIFFSLASLVAAGMRLLLLRVSISLSFITGADLSNGIYRRTLYQPYSLHVNRNSSELISAISTKTNSVIFNIIGPALVILSSGLMLIVILASFFWFNPYLASGIFIGLGSIYMSAIIFSKKQLRIDSRCVAQETTNVVKALQEGLGGIRDVLIDGTQEEYCRVYRSADLPLRIAQGRSLFVAQWPRFFIEAIGMVTIAFLAYYFSLQEGGIIAVIATLALLALGAQRLLPLMQQVYLNISVIRANHGTLNDVLSLLDQKLPSQSKMDAELGGLKFEKFISLEGVGFQYGTQLPLVLENITFEIQKGERVGFIGATGSGKSTLLDIVMGLLECTHGSVKIDGVKLNDHNQRAWQMELAHVPQNIFLADSSVAQNIAFGIHPSQINMARVMWAARCANIDEVINQLPKKFETQVGERGVRLSGGQCQRLGIARALYKNANVLILDEATSALDESTEISVMQSINHTDSTITILMIAHRLSTLKNCSKIFQIQNGTIANIWTYEQLVSANSNNEIL